jgi:hypothetical protein
MSKRDLAFEPWASQVVLRTSPNWTAVAFLGGLGGLHLTIALPSFVAGYWEGYLSLVLGTAFVCASVACWGVRREFTVLRDERRIRIRHGLKRLNMEQSVPFESVKAVRVTLMPPPLAGDSRVEVLCGSGEFECPSTPVPRQLALFLAMTMKVRLIKVHGEAGAAPERLGQA